MFDISHIIKPAGAATLIALARTNNVLSNIDLVIVFNICGFLYGGISSTKEDGIPFKIVDDNILDIVYDDDEFDIIVGWGKCINYEPLNDEEENYINHKNDYEEIFKNRFIPTIWHLKNETILKIHDKLLNKTIVNYNCFNEKHADFLYRNYIQEQECNYIDKMLTEEELQKEMFNEL